jgi:hypothetical protein
MANINISFHSLAAPCCWADAELKMEQKSKIDVMILIFIKTVLYPFRWGIMLMVKGCCKGLPIVLEPIGWLSY